MKGRFIIFTGLFLAVLFILSAFIPVGGYKARPFILEYPAYFGGRFSIPADNPLTHEGIQLGRKLFYEEKLSANNRVSCATCHQQKLAFTDGKKFSTGIDGVPTKRNSMSLANLLWVRNFFWDGRAIGLEAQAVFPMTDPHEMGQSMAASVEKLKKEKDYPGLFNQAFGTPEINEDRMVKAISQFERTLVSAGSRYDDYLNGSYTPTQQEQEGMGLFMMGNSTQNKTRGANCGHCHGTPKLYKELFHNNGLDAQPVDAGRMDVTGEKYDLGRFRVPTLRNIALTGPYMHDGRFATLEEVLDHYNDHISESETLSPFLKNEDKGTVGIGLKLSGNEKQAILAFLHMLTDSAFINNPGFSDPDL